MKDEAIEIEYLEIQAKSIFEKRTLAENFSGLNKLTPWNTFKSCVKTISYTVFTKSLRQWVAIGSLFQSKAMFRRVLVSSL